MRRAFSWVVAFIGLGCIAAFGEALDNFGQPLQIGGANGIAVPSWAVLVAAPIVLVLSLSARLRLVSARKRLPSESGILRDENWVRAPQAPKV